MIEPIIPNVMLTVVIADDSLLIHENEPVMHRTVHIKLTEDQLKQLALRNSYETHAMCFLEEQK